VGKLAGSRRGPGFGRRFRRREPVIYWAFSPSILYKSGTADRRHRGPVAQGIEQQPSKLKVAGSNPAGVATTICFSNIFKHLAPGL
jgi:hypothetical protein